jgi:hypothetical protein
MAAQQGDLSLLNDPVAQGLLKSDNMAHLAYTWTDGTPRVVPIWFHWNGVEVVVSSPPAAPKLKALKTGQKVAVSIDEKTWPYQVLYIRGSITVDWVDGVADDYAKAAVRYLGEEVGGGWLNQLGPLVDKMARVVVKPEWVGIMHIETRPPSAVVDLMAGAGG